MKLFISYARVEKPFCIQVWDFLSRYEVWCDARLYGGACWWDEILQRLDWCECFVYLVSSTSLASEYCTRELNVAISLNRPIIPILLERDLRLPKPLSDYHYIDASDGFTAAVVRDIMDAVHVVELNLLKGASNIYSQNGNGIQPKPVDVDFKQEPIHVDKLFSIVAIAMQSEQYDNAVYLLREAIANGVSHPYIDIHKILREAEKKLEEQTKVVEDQARRLEMERSYQDIADLVRVQNTSSMGCEAFNGFIKNHPDYDPLDLASMCQATAEMKVPKFQPSLKKNKLKVAAPDVVPVTTAPQKSARDIERFSAMSVADLPLLEWCEVDDGMVTMNMLPNGELDFQSVFVSGFAISKYPVTVAQYQVFLDDPMGYSNLSWWHYSAHAHSWRVENKEPRPPRFSSSGDLPRENVNWYDAMAFCYWLSDRLGKNVTLPKRAQWLRAAQGDAVLAFAYGNVFDPSLGNTRESALRKTTPVTCYEEAKSLYGVVDMTGNCWEWCLDPKSAPNGMIEITSDSDRPVQGGSFVSEQARAHNSFCYYLNPKVLYPSIGFRLVISE